MTFSKLLLNLTLFAVMAGLSSCGYNSMVQKEEQVQGAWSQVENVYQRRADLIPNLVSTVKGAAESEKGILTEVIEARSRATSINIDAGDLDEAKIKQYQQAQDALSGSLSRLLAVAESYPAIKSNENFVNLQAQLEGTENRIAVERRKFNSSVQDYNSYIRQFPNNLFAGIFGFDKKGYFQAAAGSDKAPTVEF